LIIRSRALFYLCRIIYAPTPNKTITEKVFHHSQPNSVGGLESLTYQEPVDLESYLKKNKLEISRRL
jgi:hypothetical protein